MLQLIIPSVLISSFLFFLPLEGATHSKSRARPVPAVDGVAGVCCGEDPGGQGRERDEREVVEVRVT